MNPFTYSQTGSKSSVLGRFAARPALVTFLLCLGLGLAAVLWRAKGPAKAAQASARAEALARGAALELRFSQALTAAEVLGALARQSGGAITNYFQKLATELLAAHPGLASLELQPGGVVSDIAPRGGYVRAIGFNVLKDPAQRPGAHAAIQNRALTVAGPLTLYDGAPGVVARVPVFQRGRDGRDYFWGFVAASMRLRDPLDYARMDELSKKDCDYAFFSQASARQRPVLFAGRGSVLQDGVRQVVRVQNLEFWLALKPRGGWTDKTKVVFEILGVLAVSGLLGLLANLLESRHSVEAALAEANQRLARETADRKKAQEDCRSAKDGATAAQAELKQARSALQQAEPKAAEPQARSEGTTRSSSEAGEVMQAKLKQAEQKVSELQTKLDAATRAADEAAQAKQAELKQAQSALQQAGSKITELQARSEATIRRSGEAGEAVQTKLKQAEQNVKELQAKLDAATRAADEAAQAKQAELKQARSALQQAESKAAELQACSEAATRSSGEASEAVQAKLKQAEQKVTELQAKLDAATRTADEALQAKQAELKQAHTTLWQAQQTINQLQARVDGAARTGQESAVAGQAQLQQFQTVITGLQARLDTATRSAETSAAKLAQLERNNNELKARLQEAQAELSVDPKAAQRKKARRNDQMDLFGGASAAGEAPARPAANAGAKASAVETSVSAAGAPDLPVIDGLATADGLARAGGNLKVYLKALGQFAEQQGGTPEKIRDALVQGDAPAAERIVLALKITANNIGATAVHNAAAALARAIHERSDPGEMEFLWAGLEKALSDLTVGLKPLLKPKEDKPAPARRLPAPPPVNPAELRKAVGLMMPLLADADPGAKDCLRDNRATFRSAFTAEAYVEFEQLIKGGDFAAALEHLKKAAKKYA